VPYAEEEDDMGRLEGRVAVVTGAGRGIGAEVAKAMAREGASVVVNDLGVSIDGTKPSAGPADAVVAEILAAGGKAVASHESVADHAAAELIIRKALDEFGGLDVLVNVAGILRDRMLFNMTEEEWDAVIDVHLKGTFNTSKFAAMHWRQERKGNYRLINFTSGAGLWGGPGQPNYSAAKMGIVGFTFSTALALARYGVTANCIAPGAWTRMAQTVPSDQLDQVGFDPNSGEMGPENVAPSVLYLASEQSGWLTSRVIGAEGYKISLYSNPQEIRAIYSRGPWDVDEAFRLMELNFRAAIEGHTMYTKPYLDQMNAAVIPPVESTP
jgi:NAD(P)-dependent dehydrogenase (short-subunit alcohol dehydrogenase family)